MKGIYIWIIGAVLVIALFVSIFLWGRSSKANQSPPPLDLPTGGSGIPVGWSATPSAVALHNAMQGWGTDYELIISTLTGLTDDQLIAVFNEFNNKYFNEGYGNLIDWFNDDLSGVELQTVLAYLNGLI